MAESFPEILSRLRKERRLNQRTAAAALHISQALLSHYENGLREPGLSFVDAACRYYNVSADYLLGRSTVRTSFSGTEDLPEDLRRLADTGSEALHALLAGLRTSPHSAEDVRELLNLLFYRLMRPYDRSESELEEGQVSLLADAAAGLLNVRLHQDGAAEKLRFEIPEALRREAEAQLTELMRPRR